MQQIFIPVRLDQFGNNHRDEPLRFFPLGFVYETRDRLIDPPIRRIDDLEARHGRIGKTTAKDQAG